VWVCADVVCMYVYTFSTIRTSFSNWPLRCAASADAMEPLLANYANSWYIEPAYGGSIGMSAVPRMVRFACVCVCV